MKIKHTIISLLGISLIFFLSPKSYSQEYIIDPSFKIKDSCPKIYTIRSLDILPFWHQPTLGTPDYFHRCSRIFTNIDLGKRITEKDTSFIGLCLENRNNYREYISSKLLKPLEKDKEYTLRIELSLAENSDEGLEKIGIAFSDSIIIYNTSSIIPISEDLYIKDDNGLLNSAWKIYEAKYTAKGGEAVITIGNFEDTDNTLTISKKGAPEKYADIYYFINYISLKPSNDRSENPLLTYKLFSATKDDIILDKIYFNTGDTIPINDHLQLEQLANFLNTTNKAVIILGFTDSIGSQQDNLILSEKRAENIARQLVDLNVNKNQITAIGKGVDESISLSNSEKRRIEIIIR